MHDLASSAEYSLPGASCSAGRRLVLFFFCLPEAREDYSTYLPTFLSFLMLPCQTEETVYEERRVFVKIDW